MSAPNFVLAAIMGTHPNVNPFLQPIEPTLAESTAPASPVASQQTTQANLAFESFESEVEMNLNGRPRRAAAPTKMMSIGPPIPLIQAHKARPSKSKRKSAAIDEEQDEPEVEDEQTPSKSAKRRTGGKGRPLSRAAVDDSSDEDYETITPAAPTKNRKRKYANITKPARKTVERDSSQSSKSTATAKKDRDKDKSKIPESKRKADQASALLGRKGKGRPIPVRVEDCDPIDLMMWQWRHSGRSWDEIRKEYVKMTGQMPGRSSLSVRLAKMEDNFIDSGGANDILLLKLKDDVEKELDALRWQRVAEKMKVEKQQVDANAGTLRKRYNAIKESGWLLGDAVKEVKVPKSKPDLATLLAETHDAVATSDTMGAVDRAGEEDDTDVEGEQEEKEEEEEEVEEQEEADYEGDNDGVESGASHESD